MLLCKICVVIYVLCCDFDLGTCYADIGNLSSVHFKDTNPKNNNGRLTVKAATTKKNVIRNSNKQQAIPSTTKATYVDDSKHQTTKLASGLTNSLNLPRKWPILRSRNDGIKGMDAANARKKTAENKEPVLLTPYNLVQQMNEMCEKLSNANITIEKIGRTLEYNDIVILKIAEKKTEVKNTHNRANKNKYENETPAKKIVFIVHGLTTMGLENIPGLTMSDQFMKLVSYYLEHLDKFDIFIMPMANPDGSKLGAWNKNVAPQSACIGVALDRNFDVAWNVSKGVSSCSQHYPGPFPFSEPETKAVQSVFQRYSHRIVAYFHVHAGTYEKSTFKGDAVLFPRGYTDVVTDDDKYVDLRAEIDEAMKNASFRVVSVTVDTLYNWYGQVAGTSVDYASTVYGISYALELVMQPYEYDISDYALKEIWKRVIDVVFSNIWRNALTNQII